MDGIVTLTMNITHLDVQNLCSCNIISWCSCVLICTRTVFKYCRSNWIQLCIFALDPDVVLTFNLLPQVRARAARARSSSRCASSTAPVTRTRTSAASPSWCIRTSSPPCRPWSVPRRTWRSDTSMNRTRWERSVFWWFQFSGLFEKRHECRFNSANFDGLQNQYTLKWWSSQFQI